LWKSEEGVKIDCWFDCLETRDNETAVVVVAVMEENRNCQVFSKDAKERVVQEKSLATMNSCSHWVAFSFRLCFLALKTQTLDMREIRRGLPQSNAVSSLQTCAVSVFGSDVDDDCVKMKNYL
jgi:hypothetical protein